MRKPVRRAGNLSDDDLLGAAREAARLGAAAHREARGTVDASGWSEKGRSDFVTEVDLEAERRILSVLLGRFPTHSVLAEEGTRIEAGQAPASGESSPRGGIVARGDEGAIRWIVDPLDGTTNWLHGYPEYAVSIAAEDGEGIRAAVVLNSETGELFEASRGGGARRDGRPIAVSSVSDLRLALVGTGFPFKKLEVLPRYLSAFEQVLRATSGIRRGGAAALDLCDLACGRLDAFFEYWLQPWDVAAGALIVREAGGVFERLYVPGLEGPERFGPPAPAGLLAGGFLGANALLISTFRSLVESADPAPDR